MLRNVTSAAPNNVMLGFLCHLLHSFGNMKLEKQEQKKIWT